MARLWSSGFEINSATSNIEWRTCTNSPTISSTTVRTGGFAGRITSLAAGTPKYFQNWIGDGGDGDGPYFCRAYFRVATAPAVQTTIIGLQSIISGDNVLNIQLTTDLKLELHNATAGQVGSDSAALSLNTWYRIEFKIDASGGAGADELTARIDGVNFASSTTLTLGTGIALLLLGGNLHSELADAGDWFWDDVAINDSTGSAQTSWPGEGRIVHLKPNGAGDNNAWKHDDGTAGDTNNYTECDEVTPDDATSYVKRIDTGSHIDDYACEGSADGGIDSFDTITLVAIWVRAGAISATSTNRFGNVRIKSASGATVLASADLDWSVNGWLTTSDTASTVLMHPLVSYTDPTTTVAWTPTGTNSIDNMQIGFINTSSSTNEIRVTTIHALVEYVDGAAASGQPVARTLLGVGL